MTTDELLAQHSGIRLDIGCGAQKQAGFVGMDKQALPGVDIVCNFNIFPWPLPDECVLTAVASHVVEHISPIDGHFIDWMNEVWRVMKVGGEFAIVTPHGHSSVYLQDPTHCNPCNEHTWYYFDPAAGEGFLYHFYQPKPWRIKYLSWNPAANIELILVKRALEPAPAPLGVSVEDGATAYERLA